MEMLLSEDFGRRHDGDLNARHFYRVEGAENCYRCFPGPDVSLEESGHALIPLHVFEDLKEDNFLLFCQVKWELTNEGFHELTLERNARDSSLRCGAKEPAFFLSHELQSPELLIGECFSGTFEVLNTFR